MGTVRLGRLGTPVVPFYPFLGWEGSPTKQDKHEKSRAPTYSNLSNLEDLAKVHPSSHAMARGSQGVCSFCEKGDLTYAQRHRSFLVVLAEKQIAIPGSSTRETYFFALKGHLRPAPGRFFFFLLLLFSPPNSSKLWGLSPDRLRGGPGRT